jgi:hypothetical protein
MRVNLEKAVQFVERAGDGVECARLGYILHGLEAPEEIAGRLLGGQRVDGGWAAFWAPDTSSLDATCYRLAQADQLGLGATIPAVRAGLMFLRERLRPDGSWEEDESVAQVAPPWAQPGNQEARLYLTANCGYWLARASGFEGPAERAAGYLEGHLEANGRLPSYLHAHWLAAGLWLRLGRDEPAGRVIGYLDGRLPDLAASNLAWLVTALRLAGAPANHPTVEKAASLLERTQQPDGRWQSEDGPSRDVHATLEALQALRLCGSL